MAARSRLKAGDLDRITEATRQAELRTSGEIVTAIASRSGSYAGHVILAGLVVVVVFSLLYIAFLPAIGPILRRLLWTFESRQALWALVIGQAALFVLVYGLLNLIPPLKRLVISRKDREDRVKRRAESAYFRHNITSTKGSTGVLIYISLLERRVELVVDSAVAAKVPQAEWESVVQAIIAGVKQGRFVDVLCGQILRCGDLLSRDFPRLAGDVNELPDRPVVE